MEKIKAKSSIHIQPVKTTSESHNLRLRKFDYVREDLTKSNFNWGFEKTLYRHKNEIEKICQEKTGKKLQSKATPLREGVFLFDENHTDTDILNMIKGIENRFKIKPIQLSIHRDEGHYNENGEWKPNLHAHVVFDWQDKNSGKMHRLNQEDISDLQTYVATALDMPRGKKSTKKHLNALQFKAEQFEELIEKKKRN